jgi:hypothetical protein
MTCHHHIYEYELDPEAYDDTNVRRFALRARCQQCKQPVRFIGVEEGSSLMRPCSSPDGFMIVLPAVMGIEEPEHERVFAS